MKNFVKMFGLCLLLVHFVSAIASTSRQVRTDFTRTIEGIVVDKEDQPIADARVCAWGTGPMAGRLPCGESKPNGHFVIDVYRPDTYRISAENIEQGYPEAIWGFYGKLFANFPTVIVGDGGTLPSVTVKLGPKAGRVIFTILDGETNKPVKAGSITVRRVGEPKSFWSKSTAFPHGQYELLTPDAPFTVEFETWEGNGWVKRAAFDESGVAVEVIQVELGAQKEITVSLR